MTNQTTEPQAGSTPANALPQDPGEVLLKWRSHPLAQGGKRLWIVATALVLFPVGLTILYGPFFGLLALIILGGSMGPYFLPTDYTFYSGGVESRFIGVSRRYTWDQFRSYYRDRNGVLLSPFPQPSRLENFRGIYLRFGNSTDEVMRIVAERVKRPVDSSVTGSTAA